MSVLTCDTVSKVNISKLAAAVFGKPAGTIDKITGDFVGEIYKLSFDDKTVQLNILNSEKKLLTVEKNNIKACVKSLDEINKRELTAFPKVIHKDCAATIINKPYYFTDYVPGVPFSKISTSFTKTKVNEIFSEMGIYSNRVAQNKGEYYGNILDTNKQFLRWSDAFLLLLNEVLDDAEKTKTALPFESARIKERFSEQSSLLNQAGAPSLIDLELIRDHFFVDGDSKCVSGIVGCECPIFGDSLMQPVITLLYDNLDYIDCYNYGNFFSEDEKARMALYLIFFEILNSVKNKLGTMKKPRRPLLTQSLLNYREIFKKEF